MSEIDIYGEFMSDLGEQDPQILPDEVVREKIRKLRSDGTLDEEKQHLRNEIIDSNIRLIPFVIKDFDSIIPPQELVGEAFETLNRCIDIWDPNYVSPKTEEQAKFSTYVANSLRKKLRAPRSTVEVGHQIYVPPHIGELANYMRRARQLAYEENNIEPTLEEWYIRTVQLIGESGYSLRSLKSMTPDLFESTRVAKFTKMGRIGKKVSRGNVDHDTLSPKIGSIDEMIIDENENTEETVIREILKDDVGELLSNLGSRERFVVEWRFGIGFSEDGKEKVPLTLEDVAKMMGVTRERVRQIEIIALNKLRNPLINRKVRGYILENDKEIPKEESHRDEKKKVEEKLSLEELDKGVKKISLDLFQSCSPQSIKALLARSAYSASQHDGRIMNPNTYGKYSIHVERLMPMLNALHIDAFSFGERIAESVNAHLERLTPHQRASYAYKHWKDVGNFTFSIQDIDEWKEEFGKKLARWGK